MKMRRTEQGEGHTRLGYRRTNLWEIRYQSGQRIPTIWTKNHSRMSGFLLRPNYIRKSDGQPEGRDADYWERAKAELTQLWKEGNLPTGWQSSDEER